MDIKCIEETIQTAIYKIFPMTKVEITYKNALKIFIVRIRYFCYGEGEELTIRYTDEAFSEVRDDTFLITLLDEICDKIDNKIAEKEAEYAAKRRSTGSN